jgi:hypothetical protein
VNHSKVKYIIAAACRAAVIILLLQAAGKESFHSNNARVHSQEKALRTHTDLENFITHLSLSLRIRKVSCFGNSAATTQMTGCFLTREI